MSTPKQVSTTTGVITIVMTLVGWSSVPLFITHFASRIDIWTSNGWRYGFSAFLWAPVLVWGWRRRSLPAGLWRAAVVPSIVNGLGQVAFAWSFYNIDPTTATFGLRMQIVFVAVGAYLLFPSERAVLGRRGARVGIAMVLGGILGTIYFAPEAPHVPATPSSVSRDFGIALSIFSGLCFAGYALAVRHYMHSYHPVTAFAAISQYTAAGLVVAMLVLGNRSGLTAVDEAVLSRGQLGVLLISAIIGIALGHVFYYISIARLGVAVSSGVVQLQPFLVAVGSHWLLPDKPLTAAQIAAGTVAVAGAMLLLSVQQRVTRAARRAAGGVGEVVVPEEEDATIVPCALDALPAEVGGGREEETRALAASLRARKRAGR